MSNAEQDTTFNKKSQISLLAMGAILLIALVLSFFTGKKQTSPKTPVSQEKFNEFDINKKDPLDFYQYLEKVLSESPQQYSERPEKIVIKQNRDEKEEIRAFHSRYRFGCGMRLVLVLGLV